MFRCSFKHVVLGVAGALAIGLSGPALAASKSVETSPAKDVVKKIDTVTEADVMRLADWRNYRHRHYGGPAHGGYRTGRRCRYVSRPYRSRRCWIDAYGYRRCGVRTRYRRVRVCDRVYTRPRARCRWERRCGYVSRPYRRRYCWVDSYGYRRCNVRTSYRRVRSCRNVRRCY